MDPAAAHPTARRVMVVDDDPSIRLTLSQVLEDDGYEVVTAADGSEALEKLRGKPRPSLILLDLLMPGMNGWEFCAAWAREVANASVPLLVFSACGAKPDSLAPLGVAGIIPKPVDLRRLLDTIGRLVTGQLSGDFLP